MQTPNSWAIAAMATARIKLASAIAPSPYRFTKPFAPPAIVLNYAYWVRTFGAAPSVLGRTVRLDSTTVTIVGVADPHFTNLTPGKPLDFFMPFSVADSVRGEWWRSKDRVADPTNWWVVILGRLKP